MRFDTVFRTAGHNRTGMPLEVKTDTTGVVEQIEEAYKLWWGGRSPYDRGYTKAKELVEGIPVDMLTIEQFMVSSQDNPQLLKSGSFVSALYKQLPTNVHVYDLSLPIHGLGRALYDIGSFVVQGTAGDDCGYFCGVVVVTGSARARCGVNARVLLVEGGVGEHCGVGSQIATTFVEARKDAIPGLKDESLGGMRISYDELIKNPRLRSYIQSVLELCHDPHLADPTSEAALKFPSTSDLYTTIKELWGT